MDQGIYYPTSADYGVYLTRRYPKGISVPSGQLVPGIPTSPVDPNANPLTVQRLSALSAIAPHALTERWRYTVPPRRRAVLQNALAHVNRVIAAAPVATFNASIIIRRANGDTVPLTSTPSFDNTVGYTKSGHTPGPLELFEGDAIFHTTHDDSTGGAVTYAGSFTAIEYDSVHDVMQNGSFGASGASNGLSSAFKSRLPISQGGTLPG